MVQAIVNGRVFDGDRVHEGKAVLIEGPRIVAVVDEQRVPARVTASHDLRGGLLIPGFIDLQVNGGGGVLFNATPTVDGIRAIGAAHRNFGTTGFLPTLISTDYDVMRAAVAAVEQALAEGVPGVLGIHLEGPFLAPARRGAHAARHFRALDEQGFEILTSLRRGRTLVTLAPELTAPDTIRALAGRGVIVSAGHSEASYEQARESLAAGVRGFTHLFNAMPPLRSREPGIVGAALADGDSWFGIIADGHHVHPATLRLAVAAKRRGGALLVTDAMPTVGAAEKSFVLDGETIVARDGRLTNAAGTLAGSDLDMLAAVHNAAAFAGVDWFEAVRMASLYPARALGLDGELGAIRPGFRANLVALDAEHRVEASWIDGVRA